jgi:hypothetical protein
MVENNDLKNEAVGWDNGRNLLNMSIPDEGYS